MNELEYLGRNLNNRVYEVAEEAGVALTKVMAQASARGALASGGTILQFRQEALRIFTEKSNEAAQFTYSLTKSTELDVVRALSFCTKRMVEVIMEHVAERTGRLGIHGSMNAETQQTRDLLAGKQERLIDDYSHGMMGSARLKKDPVISVVNNQMNSPGGVQQVGFGNFSQSAFTQQQNVLVRAIDDVLASQEYSRLGQTEKDAFKDIADAVKDEASKPKPDDGKLKRWGTRLVDLTKQLGMKVAEGTLTKVLTDIFTI